MNTYKYKGEHPAFIPNVGTVQPNDTIETEATLEGPLFEAVGSTQATNEQAQVNGVSGLQPNAITEAEKVAELPQPETPQQIPQELN